MSSRTRLTALLLLALALALGGVLRVEGVADRPFFGDEHHTLLLHRRTAPPLDLGEAGYGEILSTFDMTGSHVVLPFLQRVALDLVGPGPLSYRLPALVPGLLLLCLSYPLLRGLVGRVPALLATLALAASPMHVFYSHFGRAYALVMFTSVLLVHCVLRGLESLRSAPADPPGGFLRTHRWWIASFFLAAFTPYCHLSAAGFVFALGVCAIAVAAWQGGSARAGLVPAVTFATAALACALLFLPVYGQVVEYMNVQPEKDRPSTILGIPILLYGGRWLAVAGAVSLVTGSVLLWRRDRAAWLVCATTLVGPLAGLLVLRPHGMEYAYARYLFCALPFLLGFLALSFVALVRRLVPDRDRADVVALVSGAALTLLAFVTGPRGPGAVRGPFDNSYLSMYSLPAFDEPFPGTSEFYSEIAADADADRIIEFPPIWTRASLLYRNYALTHGKAVTIGYDAPMPGGMRGGPYERLAQIEPGGADYLVLHRDPTPEVRRYFRFVYDECVPRHRSFGTEGFLERHRATFASNLPSKEALANTSAALRKKLGPAWRKSEELLVWKLGD